MKLDPLPFEGAWLITPDRTADTRGHFEHVFDKAEFEKQGLVSQFDHVGVSHNWKRGTFRGLHFQWPPAGQTKLIRCIQGVIKDVILDIRPDSKTFMEHVMVSLTDLSRSMIYLPSGFAHGFQTLADETKVEYHIAGAYDPERADGYCWRDPAFDIWLPLEVSKISLRDNSYPRFDPHVHKSRFSV